MVPADRFSTTLFVPWGQVLAGGQQASGTREQARDDPFVQKEYTTELAFWIIGYCPIAVHSSRNKQLPVHAAASIW